MGIQKYKKQKIPNRSDQQKLVNRVKCATLYRKYRDREWILDDESYFTKSHSTINGNDNFYSDIIDFAPANVKFRRKHKYEKKLLVWTAMSPRGIYWSVCLPRQLFSLKTASFYQKKLVLMEITSFGHSFYFLCENLIHHVDKVDYPANLPEVRPIEDFLSISKSQSLQE